MRTMHLDLWCLNRPFDDQHQARVRIEAEAVLAIIELVRRGELKWIGSDILDLESSGHRNTDQWRAVEALLSCANSKVAAGERERQRGSAGAEVLLTTDDRLQSRAAREKARLAVQVENPAKWYSEAISPWARQ
jgi:hypothetical protein